MIPAMMRRGLRNTHLVVLADVVGIVGGDAVTGVLSAGGGGLLVQTLHTEHPLSHRLTNGPHPVLRRGGGR